MVDIGSSPDLLIEQEELGKQLAFNVSSYGVNESIGNVYPLVL